MDIDELSRHAKRGEDPDELDLHGPERLLFFELRELYRQHKKGEIVPQVGAAKKRKAVAEYDRFAMKLADADKVIAYEANFWKRVELSAKEYTANPSIETADAFFEAVYRLRRAEKRTTKENE